jgi:hypothetical protein
VARLAHLCRPASPLDLQPAGEWAQWSPWPEFRTCFGVSSRNSASPLGDVIIIDDDEDGKIY